MTETALMADIVLPATMFMEHDDLYQGGGHQHFQLGPKLVEPPGECRSNHEVICGAGEAASARSIRGFGHEPARDHRLDAARIRLGRRSRSSSGRFTSTRSRPFREAHYLDGFAYPDGRFRFRPDWTTVRAPNDGAVGPWQTCRRCRTIGRRSRRRRRSIRSASPRARRGSSSTRPSPRRRPRSPRSAGRR